MIDYALRFNSEADAIAAATGTKLGSFDNSSPPIWSWSTEFVLPNVKAWRISQITGSPPVRTYLSGWFCFVSLPKANKQLTYHPNLQFALYRDGPPYVVRNNIGAVIKDVDCEPFFAGHHYPIGGEWGDVTHVEELEFNGSGKMQINAVQQ